MRIVGLISGGKDSIFNLLHCLSAGHDVVALANIASVALGSNIDINTDRFNNLDSFMYQTVGQEVVQLFAKATGLPIFRQPTLGTAKWQKLSYEPTENDEVEDLYKLLLRVKQETDCEGVSVGAIASDYQRNRVENICSRLGLTCFAYLWRMNQSELLRSMIKAGIHAVTIKVAAAGLDPNHHLGLTLEQLDPIVHKLEKKYGVNVCGEGGEYETLVIDCPFFHEKILLEETHVIQDSTSGYLSIKSAKVESKFGDLSREETFNERLGNSRLSVSSPRELILHCLKDIPVEESHEITSIDWENFKFSEPKFNPSVEMEQTTNYWVYFHLLAASSISEALISAKKKLREHNLELSDIAFVSLWLRKMDEFANVNLSYVKELSDVAPARACVATVLPLETPVAIELIAHKKSDDKRVIHVKSVSHWAPANIGPYSQSFKVGGIIFVAGQIPLIPGSMTLLDAPLAHQLRLALRHVERILAASASELKDILQITIFVSEHQNVQLAVKMLKTLLPNVLVSGLVVSALPRFADLELLTVAAEELLPTSSKEIVDDYGCLKCTTELVSSANTAALVAHITVASATKSKELDLDPEVISQALTKCMTMGIWNLGLKIFFNPKVEGLEEAIRQSIGVNPITAVPVVMCQSSHEIVTIIGVGISSSDKQNQVM